MMLDEKFSHVALPIPQRAYVALMTPPHVALCKACKTLFQWTSEKNNQNSDMSPKFWGCFLPVNSDRF